LRIAKGEEKHREMLDSDADRARQTIMVPTVKIDRSRITLARLRFMGEEPHPSQLAIIEEPAE